MHIKQNTYLLSVIIPCICNFVISSPKFFIQKIDDWTWLVVICIYFYFILKLFNFLRQFLTASLLNKNWVPDSTNSSSYTFTLLPEIFKCNLNICFGSFQYQYLYFDNIDYTWYFSRIKVIFTLCCVNPPKPIRIFWNPNIDNLKV